MDADQLVLDLFGDIARAETAAPARTWADVRRSERVVYDMPGSEWRGHWAVRRIEPHPHARYLLIVDLIDGQGRTWATWIHRETPMPGPGFTEA